MALPQEKLPVFTAKDYLAWEALQATRSEYVRGEVFAMAGGEDRHMTVAGNLFAASSTSAPHESCGLYRLPQSPLKLARSRSVGPKRKVSACGAFCEVSKRRNKVHVAKVCFESGVAVIPCR